MSGEKWTKGPLTVEDGGDHYKLHYANIVTAWVWMGEHDLARQCLHAALHERELADAKAFVMAFGPPPQGPHHAE